MNPFVQSTLVSAIEELDTARELIVLGAEVPFCLKDAIDAAARAQTKIANVLALIEAEKREAVRAQMLGTAETEPPR